MTTSTFKPADRGARFRPPDMRVSTRAYYSTSGPPGFENERPAHDALPQALHWGMNGDVSTLTLKVQLGYHHRFANLRAEEAAQGKKEINYPGYRTGDEIILWQIMPADAAGNRPPAREWFRGHIVQRRLLIQSNPDAESFMVTAFGPEFLLKHHVAHGQWTKSVARDDLEVKGTLASLGTRDHVIHTDLPIVFNPGGKPNASQAAASSGWERWRQYRLASENQFQPQTEWHDECHVFEAPGRKVRVGSETRLEAEHWTAYTALRSLIEAVDDYDVISPWTGWPAIKKVLQPVVNGTARPTVIGEVRAEGINLLDAMRAILLPVGFGFALYPDHDVAWQKMYGTYSSQGVPTRKWKYRLYVFSLSDGARVKRPRLAAIRTPRTAITSDKGQRAAVQRIEFVQDASHIANEIRVIGDARRRQAVFEFTSNAGTRELHPCWDTTAYPLSTYARANVIAPCLSLSQATNEQFRKRHEESKDHPEYKHIYCSFVANEDGGLSGAILNGDTKLGDFKAFGIDDDPATNWMRRPRPIGRTFIYDEKTALTRTKPAFVQVGIEGNDDTWVRVPGVSMMRDRLGFTIRIKTISQWFPWKNLPTQALITTYGGTTYLTALHNAIRNAGDHKLRLRLVGSIQCDRTANGTASRLQESSWPFRHDRVIYAPNRFRRRDILTNPFAWEGAPQAWTDGDVVDDRADAERYAESIRDVSENSMGHCSIVIRGLKRHSYRPGDAIPATSGRVVNLAAYGGAGAQVPIVASVNCIFAEGANRTELALDSPLLGLAR